MKPPETSRDVMLHLPPAKPHGTTALVVGVQEGRSYSGVDAVEQSPREVDVEEQTLPVFDEIEPSMLDEASRRVKNGDGRLDVEIQRHNVDWQRDCLVLLCLDLYRGSADSRRDEVAAQLSLHQCRVGLGNRAALVGLAMDAYASSRRS